MMQSIRQLSDGIPHVFKKLVMINDLLQISNIAVII